MCKVTFSYQSISPLQYLLGAAIHVRRNISGFHPIYRGFNILTR